MAKRRKHKKAEVPPMPFPLSQSDRKGPFLSAALIAEKVLTETDRTMTFVRVIDRSFITPQAIAAIQNGGMELQALTIVLTFKAWGYGGESSVHVVQGGPSGKSDMLGMSVILFDGTQGRSYSVFCPVALKWEGNGFYWFDVFLDNQFVTRIPLEVNVVNPPKKE